MTDHIANAILWLVRSRKAPYVAAAILAVLATACAGAGLSYLSEVFVAAFAAAVAIKVGEAAGRLDLALSLQGDLDELQALEESFIRKTGAVWPNYADWPVSESVKISERLHGKIRDAL